MKIVKIIAFFIAVHSFGQNRNTNDSISLDYSLKFKVLDNSSTTIDSEELRKMDSIISKTNDIKVEKINSKGFNKIDFYKISTKAFDNYRETYIIGYQYDIRKFFRLKGFLNNDFYYLYKYEIILDTEQPTHLLTKKNKQLFLKNHTIQDLDLECLIHHINDKENWKIPCLNPSQKVLIDDFGEEHL